MEPKKNPSKKRNNKRHDPTSESRAEVAALVSFGESQSAIATYLGISHDTLERKYKEELKNSSTKANAKVANCLYKKATKENDLSAMIFWLKTRARWRTTDKKEEADATKQFATIIEKLIADKKLK